MRRRTRSGAIAPAVAFCVLASGMSLAAPAVSPAPPSSADAQSRLPSLAAGPPEAFARPSIRAVRIETSEAPTIDADLSDPAWAKAAVIDNFTQRSPNPYEPATERTVVRILYDENNLYFSFYNYDRAPDRNRRPQHAARRAGLHIRFGDALSRSRPDPAQRVQFRNRRVGRTDTTSSSSTTPRN